MAKLKKFDIIDHTADIGVRSYGKDLKELFTNSAEGLFNIILDVKSIKFNRIEPAEITLEASNIEELLVSWLRELLYRFSADSFVFSGFQIKEIREDFISAIGEGQKIEIPPELFKIEVKAVTYHSLSVKKVGNIWQAEVIFDV